MTPPVKPQLVNPNLPEQDPRQYEYEFDLANQQRKALLDEIDARVKLARELNSAHIADIVGSSHQMVGQNADGTQTMYQQATTPPDQHELNQLIGAAHHYGIPNPESIEPLHLKSQILQRRLAAQPTDVDPSLGQRTLNTVEQFGASIGLGSAESLIALAQRLPLIGDAVSRMHVTQQADQNIAQANEQMVAGMTSAQASAFRTASNLGGMVGYALPAGAAWNVAGSIGKLSVFARAGAAITNPLARAAIQGATSSLILEGGGHKSLEQLGETALEGAAAGAAFQYLHDTVPRLSEKIRSFFPSKGDPVYPSDLRGASRTQGQADANGPQGAQYGRSGAPGEAEAEWYYEAQTPENLQKLLGPGSSGGPNGGPPPSAAGALIHDPAAPFSYEPNQQLAGGPRLLPSAPIDVSYEVIPEQQRIEDAFGNNAGRQIQQTFEGQSQGQPSNETVPGPYGKLMSPERAAMQSRMDNVVEQRDVARRALETDQLTGQGNRAALMRVRDQIDADPQMAWTVFDGKQFKAVNDQLGHDVGDGVLANFGSAIQQTAVEMNLPARVFRQGGDEFSAIVPKDQAAAFVARVKELSYQRVNGVETRLDGYHADTFAEADLNLMQNKRSSVQAPAGNPLDRWDSLDIGQRQVALETAGVPQQYAQAPIHALDSIDQEAVGRVIDRMFPVEAAHAPPTLSLADAAAEGATLSKHTTLLEGGDPVTLSGASEITVADVADAAFHKNPGTINVIRGIGDVGKTIKGLIQKQTGTLFPTKFRLVKRGDNMDILISNGSPVTDKIAQQYSEFGMYEGMGGSSHGYDVVIVKPGSKMTLISDPYTGGEFYVPTREVLPGSGSNPSYNADERLPNADKIYNGFRSYAMKQMREAQQAIGNVEPYDWYSHETATQLPRLLNSYTEQIGLDDEVSKATIEAYVSQRRVNEFRDLDQESASQAIEVAKELNLAASTRPVDLPIHDIVSTKGFDYVPTPGEAGGTLVDRLSDLRVPVDTPESAYEFIRNFTREVPDYTPVSEVPFELTSISPNAANPGDALEPVFDDPHARHYQSASATLRNVNAQINQLSGGAPSNALGTGAPSAQSYAPGQSTNQGGNANYIPPAGGGGGGTVPPTGGTPATTPPGGNLPAQARTLGQALAQESTRQPLGHLLQELDSAWLRWFEPFRRATIRIQDFLDSIGIPEGKLHQQYYNLVTAIDVKHNLEHPWLSEATDIHDSFNKRIWQRNGVVTWASTLQGAQRQAYTQAAGYGAEDIAAQDRLNDFYDRFFTSRGGSSQEVYDYIGDVAARQAVQGHPDPFSDVNGRLTPATKFVETLAKERNMQFRKMDSRVFTTSVIREAFYIDHVKPHFDVMAATWRDPLVEQHAPGLHSIVDKWLDNVRYGYNPEWDAAVQGIRYAFNKAGVPVNDAEIVNFWNGVYTQFYRGAIGGRAAPIFRDATSPLLAAVRIGTEPVAKTWGDFILNRAERDAMTQRALRGGWLTEGMVRVPNADAFESVMQNPQFQPQIPQNVIDRREMYARVGDVVYEFTPKSLRGGIQGTFLDPMLPYTKLNELNRVVSGEAGYREADKALTAYQDRMTKLQSGQFTISGQNVIKKPFNLRYLTSPGEMIEAQSVLDAQDHFMKNLMDESHADAYPKAIQDEFRQLVAQGDWEGAKALMANEAANSQMRYGQKEAPIGVRQAGQFGRMGMMLGSFTNQYVGQMRELFTDPAIPGLKKVAMANRMGMYQGIVGAAAVYTGWSFNRWLWHHALTFGGGPFATGLADAYEANTGRFAEAMGENLSPMQTDALARSRRTSWGQAAVNTLAGVNPYRSTIREASDLFNIASRDTPNQAEVFARRAITGDRGIAIDVQQTLNSQRVVTPDDIDGAIQGNAESLSKFSAAEQSLLANMRNVPRAARWQVWSSYQNQRVNEYNKHFRDTVGTGAGARQ